MVRPLAWKRFLTLSVGLSAAACAEKPWTYGHREELSVGGEVFHVFCKRAAKDAAPQDLTGTHYEAMCLGQPAPQGMAPPPISAELTGLLQHREKLVRTVDRVLGDNTVAQKSVVTILEPDEIRAFLSDLVPLYDAPDELLPNASRDIAAVLARVIDSQDLEGKKALDALSQITGRSGYRKMELALGLLRPLLQYPQLDTFAENGLKVIAKGGKAEASLDELSLGLAMELANYDPTPPAPDSTLLIARDLLLSPIDQLDQPQRAPIYITKRDARGQAVPFGDGKVVPPPFVDADGDGLADIDEHGRFVTNAGDAYVLPSPYRVANEPANTPRDPDGRALNPANNGALLYSDFDAQPTLAAAMLRETARMAVPLKPGDRTSLEKIGRGLSALFGLQTNRTVNYGNAKVNFVGPDPATGAVHDLIYGLGIALKTDPDKVRRFVQMFTQAMIDHEPEMAAFVDMALRINERGKNHPEAVLVGEMGPGTPHRFWDDLIAVGARMTKRKGMIQDLVKTIVTPEMVALGPLIADWMQYKDLAKYKNADFKPSDPNGDFTTQQAEDLNAQVELKYVTEVDRTMPDVGNNRSVWQQTMSMVHNLRQPICNKDGAELHLVLSSATDPLGQITGAVHDFPWSGGGYAKCDLFEVPHMIRIWVQAILGKAKITLKPADLNLFDAAGFVSTGRIQEIETQITGFNATPTPQSFARFLFAPPNQFTQKMKPDVLMDGAHVEQIDPYALFAMEVHHPSANNMNFMEAGKPLVEVFESHELVDSSDKLQDGYLFADMLNVFHMHWGSRTDGPCMGVPACTQHADPKGKFFSYQTDLRSYEPLLVEALRDERMLEVLSNASKVWQGITIDGKDGLTIFADLVEMLLTPQKGLTYRDGRASAQTNVGEEVGYVSPLYLLLDGLKRIDQNFAAPGHAGEQDVWHAGRSDVVDLFLTIEEVGGKKRLQDRIGRSVFVRVLNFLLDRIQKHQQAGDVADWATHLSDRSVAFFDTPLVAGLLQLFEKSWDQPESGRELMKFIAYLVDEQHNEVGFETTLVAVADLLQLLQDSQRIQPILDLAAEAATPGASKAVHGTGPSAVDPRKGILRHLVELQNRLLQLHKRRPSTLARVAGNLVRTAPGEDETPLEALIDVVTEVERMDPKQPANAVLARQDLQAIANVAHRFLADDGHGLERLYAVIRNRTMHPQQQEQP